MTGESTEDLRQHQPSRFTQLQHEIEARLCRSSRITLWAGISIVIAAVITALCSALIAGGPVFSNGTARVFASLGFMAVFNLGTALTVVGGLGPHFARLRENDRLLRQNIEGVRKLVAQLADDVHTLNVDVNNRLDTALPTVQHLAAHVPAIEDVLQEIAKQLPDVLERREWVGFNNAVREGFVEGNGTDSAPRRRGGHMNLVRPDPEPPER